VDNNGYLDIAVGGNAQNVVYRNNGSNFSTLPSWNFGPGGNYAESLALGDVDENGYLDIAVGNSGEQNVVYRNNGSDFSTLTPWNFGTGSDATYSVAFGDVDGDGNLDIAVGNSWAQNVVYRNNGSNFSTLPSWNFGPGGDDTRFVAFGDVDENGYLDLAVGNYNNQQNVVYLNNGSDFSTLTPWNFGPGSGNTRFVAFGDVDGNGYLDLAVGNYNQQNVVYRNNGSNFSTLPSWNFGTGSDATYSVAFGDVDGDGDLDLAVGNRLQQNVVYLNNGSDFSTSRNFGAGSDYTYSVAFGDVDRDGDLDIAVGNYNMQPNVIYINAPCTPPTLSSHVPDQNAGNIATSATIDLTFDMAMDTATLTNATIKVHGLISGLHTGTVTDQGGNVYRFDPNNDFEPGEPVTVTLTTGVQSATGCAIAEPYSFGFTIAASAGPPTLIQNFGTGSDVTYSVAFGDVDGNGYLDVAVGNSLDQNVVYLNNGSDFSTLTPWNFGPGGDYANSVAFGDIDNDGDLDLAVGNTNQQNAVYLNNGSDLTTLTPWNFGPGNDNTKSVVLGDVDGNGYLDIAVGNYNRQNTVYFNNGSDFTTMTPWNFGLDSMDDTNSLAFGDVDDNGYLDVAVGNDGQNVVYRNNGADFTTLTPWNFGTGGDYTDFVVFGDVDGNGYLDIAVGNRNNQQNVVYLNNGSDFTTLTPWNFGTGSDITRSVAFGDVDGDGYLDVAVGNDGEQNGVYLNNGSDFSTLTPWNFGTGSDNTRSVAFGDVDNDGVLDLVVGNYGGQNYINQEPCTAPTLSSHTPDQNAGNIATSATIDLTFDMAMDTATLTNATIKVHGLISGLHTGTVTDQGSNVYRFDPNNDFEPGEPVTVTLTTGIENATGCPIAEPYSFGFMTAAIAGPGDFSAISQNFGLGSDRTVSVAFGDVDGNGYLDLAVGNLSQQNVVYRNNGSDFSTLTPWNFGTGTDNTYSVAFSDVDGNGYLDLAVGNLSQQNVVYRNNGSDFSTLTPWNFGTGSDDTRSVAFGDVDGDGNLDLAVGNSSGQQNAVYRNNGADFTTLTPWNFGTGSDNTISVAFGDIDNDGVLDIAVGNGYGGQNAVYRNNGADFTALTPWNFGTGTDDTESIAFGDVDGDGNLDLAVGNSSHQQNAVYRNNGADFSTLTPWNFGIGSYNTYPVVFCDVHGDGDLDLAVGNGGGQNAVYLNNGSNFSTFQNFGPINDYTNSIAVGDVDGDGDIDLAVGNNNQQNVIYLNQELSSDFGDLPAGYALTMLANNGARHEIGSLYLGASIDIDANGQESADAGRTSGGDDGDGTDDEDGVTVSGGDWIVGSGGSVNVVVTGGPGYLSGWIDWDNNGNFSDIGDTVLNVASVVAGAQTVTFAIPPTGIPTTGTYDRFARFRLTPTNTPPTTQGLVNDGEVEDYYLQFNGVHTNTPPTAADGTVAMNEDTDHLFAGADFHFADVDAGDTLSHVIITTPPTAGQLYNDANSNDAVDTGEELSAHSTASAADIAAGRLKFMPLPDEHGTPYTVWNFRVHDGSDSSAAAYTMTCNVNSVNDAPSFTNSGNQSHLSGTVGLQTVTGWADPAHFDWGGGESDAIHDFIISNIVDGSDILTDATPPDVSNSGELTYDLTGTLGSATVLIVLQDNGGVANGGVDTSTPYTLTVSVSDNARPTITESSPYEIRVNGNSGMATIATLHATDPENDSLIWNLQTLAVHGVATLTPGVDNSCAVNYMPNPDYYGEDTLVVEVSDAHGSADQIAIHVTVADLLEIPILEGWNWISTSCDPNDSSIVSIYSEVPGLNVVQNLYGFYIPGIIDMLIDWNISIMYMVQVGHGGTLQIIGVPIDPDTPIPLNQGWNWIPYYPTWSMSAHDAFVSITTPPHDYLIYADDYGSGIYVPGSGVRAFNMNPNQGYRAFVNDDCILIYPADPQTRGDDPEPLVIAEIEYFDFHKSNYSYAVLFMDDSIEDLNLEIGDEVALFAQQDGESFCIGASVWQGEIPFTISGWNDDPLTDEKDGYTAGDPIIVRAWTAIDDQEMDVPVIFEEDHSTYESGIYSIASVDINALGTGDEPESYEFKLEQNRPNPFNPSTVIRYEIPQASQTTLRIYNIRGQLIRTLVHGNQSAGSHQAIWDARDNAGHEVASGVYFYRLETPIGSAHKRMILLR